jgi:hypothetical protein
MDRARPVVRGFAHDGAIVTPKLPAAHQFPIVVLNFAGTAVEVAQGRLLPFSIPLLAIGLEGVAAGPDILASLGISAIRRAVMLVTISVVLPVIVSVAVLVPVSIVLSVVVSLVAHQASVIILNSSSALVEVLE